MPALSILEPPNRHCVSLDGYCNNDLYEITETLRKPVSVPTYLRRWEKALQGELYYSVIGLMRIDRKASWGGMLPHPGASWETPHEEASAMKRVHRSSRILVTRAVLTPDEFYRMKNRFSDSYVAPLEGIWPDDHQLHQIEFPHSMIEARDGLQIHASYDYDGCSKGKWIAQPIRKRWFTYGFCQEEFIALLQSKVKRLS